jgi:transposase
MLHNILENLMICVSIRVDFIIFVVTIYVTTNIRIFAMPYIIENRSGKYTYLYECESWRDKDGKVMGKRKVIGKIDPVTGEKHYKPEYVERMKSAGTPMKIPATKKVFSLEDVKKSSVLEYGAFHLLKSISEKIGRADALKEALPYCWKEVFALAMHLTVNGEPFMHCADWIEETEFYKVGDMSSQRISELLTIIAPDEREHFYQAWCRHRQESEYLALDITPVSSYSELVEDVEWGYNRDGENLPQINICMLMGEKSRLPVYQTVYAGSLKDVSTLESTVRRFDRITGGKPVLAVMDKGFYSKQNVDVMLSVEHARRFVIAVPFTSGFAKNQVNGERKDIDTVGNTIRLGGETLRGITKERAWGNGRNVYAHIYFAPHKALGRREDIFGHISTLRDEAETEPEKYAKSREHKKYLNIRKSEKADSGYTVNIREDAVNAALGTHGWLVLISNDVVDIRSAIRIYRAKDVVEKGFLRLKCDLDLGRLRVHSQDRMQNKVFVGFVALILLSHIHAVMMDHDMYGKMTMKKMIRTLARHRVQTIAGERIIYPATKTQREVYEIFGVQVPV